MGNTATQLTRHAALAGALVVVAISGTAQAHPGHAAQGHIGVAKVDSLPSEVPAQIEHYVGENAKPAPGDLWTTKLHDGTTLLTHGPDPKREDEGGLFSHGTSLGVGDPERTPVCATDYYQHILYARVSGNTSNYSTAKPQIQASIRRSNAVLNEDSIGSGGPTADYKVLCDSGGIRVDQLVVSGASFNSVVNSARSAGFDDENADYTVFLDATSATACGVGSYESDESAGAGNANNLGGGYAVVYQGCWNDETAMHENGHNEGAVQYNAPYSTGSGGHCWDERDVMCYSPDGGDKHQTGTQLLCGEALHFDCGWNTYFDSHPEDGEYLDNHWNIGSPVNRFIVFGSVGSGNEAPTASFTYECSGLSCDFTDESDDSGGSIASRSWDFDDGGSSTATNPGHTFDETGTYNVSLEVTDDDGATNSVTIPVDLNSGSGVTPLKNGVAANVQAGALDVFDHYVIHVPGRQSKFTVLTSGEECTRIGDSCPPDLDLYVRRGDQPTASQYDCRPFHYGITEKCVMRQPRKGDWYVSVLNYNAPLGTEYTVKAPHRR